jgi:Glycosyl transferase family 2
MDQGFVTSDSFGLQRSDVVPAVAVIVPTYQRAHLLERVLRPLLDDSATTELFVVVDGKDDGSVEVLSRIAATDARLQVLVVDHLGQHGACDEAVKRARAEVVLFLDDDVIAEPDLVTGHARHHAGGDHQVVVGYMPVQPRSPRRPGDAPTILYAAEYEHHCDKIEADPSLVLRTLWFGNVSLRRADCQHVGLSSEFPYLYHQDQDFGLRCLRAGLSGRFDRTLAAHHLHTRPLEAFLRDAQSEGAGRWMVHHFHADIVGPFDLATFQTGLPASLRVVLRATRHPLVAQLLLQPLRLLAKGAGRIHAFKIEMLAVKLARRVEQQSGALLLIKGEFTPKTISRTAISERRGINR